MANRENDRSEPPIFDPRQSRKPWDRIRSSQRNRSLLISHIADALCRLRNGRPSSDGVEIRFSCLNESGHRRGDQNPSACFNTESGISYCHGCNVTSGASDLAKLLKISIVETAQLEAGIPKGFRAQAASRVVRMATAAQAKRPHRILSSTEFIATDCYCDGEHQRPKAFPGLGQPTMCWFYGHKADGSAQWAVLRFDSKTADGEPQKTFRQFDLEKLTWTGPAEPRPLYRLEDIAARSDEPVVLVEGEKCADALASIGMLATTTMGGANGVGKADLRPLAGRTVYLWRDNDAAGEKWLDAMHERLPEVGVAELFVIPIPVDMPVSWDVADAIAHGWNTRQIQDLIAAAESPANQKSLSGLFEEMRVVRATDLPNEIEPLDEVIEGLIEARSLAIIYGASNTGKTFFALSLADAVARGVDCYGRKVDPGVVIYLAMESPGGVRRRIKAMQRLHGTPAPDLFIVEKPLSFYQDNDDANSVVEVVRAAEQLAGRPARMVIGDTLARMAAGANENSGEHMGPVMMKFDRVAEETNAAVVIVHHQGKNVAAGSRGWSGIQAHISTEIEVDASGGFRRATVTKQRDLDSKGAAIFFRLDVVALGETKWGKPVTTCVAVADPDAAARVKVTVTKGAKCDQRIDKYRKWIELAWWFAGAASRDSFPFVPRDKLRTWLQENAGVGEKAAKNHLAPNGEGKLIGVLADAKIVKPHGNEREPGWLVVEPNFASTLMARREQNGGNGDEHR